MKITSKKNGNIKRITLHPRDTWSLDVTLARIIEPCLRQLLATTHGAPEVSNEDVPKCFHRPEGYESWETDPNWQARWTWVMLEMIWAFETIAHSKYEIDTKETQARVDNGLRLFAKYYMNLWD